MTIQKKLVWSNVLMILIPFFFALVFSAAAFKTYGNQYWEFFEEMLKDENGIYSAQSIVYKYKEDLEEGRLAGQERMEQELLDMGYHFRLRINKEVVHSSMTEEEKEMIREYFKESYDHLENVSLYDKELCLVKNTFEKEGKQFEIVAVRLETSGALTMDASYFQRYVVAFIVLTVLLTGAVIIFTDVGLSLWIARSIMKPLRILAEGTRQIADGNLDWELAYHKSDEFGEVCRKFEKMREQLKESVETRIRYDQYRKELIAGISHDLRTPLTSIKGYAEGLRDGIADTDEKKRRYYDAIHIRAADMETLLDSLSLFARLENRHHHYQLEPVNMKKYLDKFLKEYEEELCQKQVIVLTDFEAEHTTIRMDVQEMHRVFINLLENSVKYRVKENSVIRLTMESQGGHLKIYVADDGPGVPESELDKIFNSFYRVDASRTKPGSGSGLGLAIVRQIVEGHGGTIHAKNDRGLVIVITLPLTAEGEIV